LHGGTLVTNPRSSLENERCKEWLAAMLLGGAEVVIPEIAGYEVAGNCCAP